MDAKPSELIADADRAFLALSPLRRRILSALAAPGSSATLARELGLPRQQLGYHLRELEAAGLITLVETRQRRGFAERLLIAAPDRLFLDPALLGATMGATDKQDRFASTHLLATAAQLVSDTGRMQAAAASEGKRLLTFTIEAEIGLDAPSDFDALSERLTAAIAEIAADFAPAPGRRAYRLVLGGLPAPKRTETPVN